jgi:hypothetical protein
MRIKEGFVLKQVANKWIVVPVEENAIHFNGLLTLNDSGYKLFEQLQEGDVTVEMLVKTLTDLYDVDRTTAKQDVLSFIQKLKEKDLIE